MTDQEKYARAWADKALTEIPGLKDDDALCQWILDNRELNAVCAVYAPAALEKVRVALRVQARTFPSESIRQEAG